MWVRVETSRVGPARLPSAASWRGSSSFTYSVHRRLKQSGGDDAHVPENAKEFIWGERVTRLQTYNDFPARCRLGQEALSVRHLPAKTRAPPSWPARLARAGRAQGSIGDNAAAASLGLLRGSLSKCYY